MIEKLLLKPGDVACWIAVNGIALKLVGENSKTSISPYANNFKQYVSAEKEKVDTEQACEASWFAHILQKRFALDGADHQAKETKQCPTMKNIMWKFCQN